MGVNAREGFNSALSLFSSLYEDMAPADLPEGLSPDNQDVWYLPGQVLTRPALNRFLNVPVAGAPRILSLEDFPLPSGTHVGILLDANGAMWQRNQDGSKTSLITVNATGLQFKAETAFDKQFYAFYAPSSAFSASPFVGMDIPRYSDGVNIWRVTQDAPGQGPTFSGFIPPPASIAAGMAVSVNIVASAAGIVGGEIELIGKLLYYTTIIINTTTPHGLSVGQSVTIAGSTSTPSFNRAWTVAAVDSATSFEISYFIEAVHFVAGGGGTVTTFLNMSRLNNNVTAVTSAAHGFQVGWQVQISGQADTDIGGGIAAIMRDANGVVTVTTTTAHGLSIGVNVNINGVTIPDASFNGQFEVASILSPTQFTYAQGGTITASSGGSGNVQDIWNGTFIILSIPTTTSFTYFQLGPDDTTTGNGLATPLPLLPAGPRSAVLMFKSVNGAITAPSIPVQLEGIGGNSFIVANGIAIGPQGTAQRVIAFTPAYGQNYYYITPQIVPGTENTGPIITAGTVINDNVTTSAIIDFADTALLAGTQIDIAGNNLFNQVVLGPCLGVIEYQGRLGWIGETNNLKNLINPGFDGGYILALATNPPGSGANSGAGTAWTNPGNISSLASYADVNVPGASSSSKDLLAETFGFAITGVPSQINVSFQYYWTGTYAPPIPTFISAQLLKAGVPIGPAIPVYLGGSPAGTSAVPIPINLSFPISGLTASDVNNAAFGVQFLVFGGTNGAHVFIRQCSISVGVIPATPPGWTAGVAAGTTALVSEGNPGFAYQMTSAGGAADCLIQQSANQDSLGAPVLLPNRQYYARMLAMTSNIAATGNLVVDIFSPSMGSQGSVSFPINAMAASFGWVAGQISTLPSVLPTDALLRIYLNGVTSTTVVTIDEFGLIDALQPILGQQMRISYFGNEFGYDLTTGIIGLNTPGAVTAAFKERGILYMLTDTTTGGMWRTQDNGSTEPNGWGVDEFAQDVDCAGPNAVDVGEGVAWWAGQTGLRIFAGDTPKKLSQEIQPSWETINWAVTLALWVRNDPKERLVYVGLPLNGATLINQVRPMSYRSVNSTLEPPDPLHISFSGKLICSDLCRKWTRWNVPAQCAGLLSVAGAEQMIFGAGFGEIYYLNFAKFTDDDYGTIPSYYTTYFHWNHEMEQSVPELGLHRKIYQYLTAFVTGVGQLTITPLVDNLSNPWVPTTSIYNATLGIWEDSTPVPPRPQTLSTSLKNDLNFRLNVLGDRVAFKIAVAPLGGQTDAAFNLQHLVVTGKMDRLMPVRGGI